MIKILDTIRKVLFIVATVAFGAGMILNAITVPGSGSVIGALFSFVTIAFFVGAVLFLSAEGTTHNVGLGLFLGSLVISLTIGFDLLASGSLFGTVALIATGVYACSFIVEFTEFLCKKAVASKK